MEGSIRKRGAKSWEITLDLGRDENGKRDRRYFTVRETKKQAQQRQRELLTELDGLTRVCKGLFRKGHGG